MRRLKKILRITLIVFLFLIAIAFAAPYLFKKQIVQFAKKEINKSLNAKTDFRDISISFFRHFPRVSVAIQALEVVGLNEFAKDTLIAAKEVDVSLNLMSMIRGSDYKIYSININEPRIHALVTKDGKANWDIAKEDTSAATEPEKKETYKLNLQKYAIRNGYIKYDDASSNMSAEIINLNHEGSGDFTSDLFTLSTTTDADAITFFYGAIPYLSRTKTSIESDIEIDNKTNTYRFRTDKIRLNDLQLSTSGLFQLINDSTYGMDIRFNAPSTDFKSILSLVPAVYKNDFEKVKTSGKAIFNGFVKGRYSNTEIPSYNINLNIADGFFQYPDLPKPVKNINLAMKVENPDGITDHTVVNIPKGHIEFGNDPFDFHLLLKKPLTDQYIDAAAKGTLDLAGITQFLKLEAGTKLSGLVNADVGAKGNLAVIQQQKPGVFSAKGFVDIQRLYYTSKAFPQPIQNTSARINIDNPDGVADHTVIQIPSAHVEVGKDVADLTLLLKNPASDPYFEGTAKGSLNLANIAQFYAFEPGTMLAGFVNAALSFKGKKSYIDKKKYEAVQTAGSVQATNVVYKSKDYPDAIIINNGSLSFNPKNVTINDVKGSYMQTNFNTSGSFDNLIGYALKDEPLTGTLNVAADKIDLNKLMGTPTVDSSTSAPAEPFAVPKNVQLTLNTKADVVHYDKVDYKNINGALQIKDETVSLKNVQMEALDGSIAVNGSYSTKVNKKNPDISLAYDVKDLDIQKTFYAFNTVQKLMPIGAYLGGKLSSQLNLTGKLGEDMMPDLNSLTGKGNMLLIEGFLKKFAPADKLAQAFNIKELEAITLKDVKNYIEFANGKVLVKPFKVKVKEIDMEIGGMHGLDQSIDYSINMKIPRTTMGEKANQPVNNVTSRLNNKGVAVAASDVINLNVKMGGSIKNPELKLADNLKQQATDLAKQKVDSTKTAVTTAVKDTISSAKKQVLTTAKDELTKQFLGKKDTSTTAQSNQQDTKKQLQETGKGLIENLNPFKKKKKTN